MTKASNNPFPSVLINHQSNTAVATPDPIHSRLFVDSDGTLKTKDWNGTVTGIGSNFTADAIGIHAGESNPHSGYILKSVATANYDILVGTGASAVGALSIGASNTLLGTSNALVYNPVGMSTFAPDSLSASAAPSVTDDYSAGWRRGSKWVYAGTLYICVDETPGAAVWQEVGAGSALEVSDGSTTVSSADLITFSSNFAVTDQGSGDALVDIFLPAGGGGAALDVTDTITTVSSTDKITFSSNFAVTDQGSGDALVDVYFPGGGGGASAMDDLSDADTTTVAPSTGDPLLWDGTNWVPGTAVSITTGTIGAKAYHNTTQSVNNASYTAVQFNSEDWDTDAFHDTATNNTRFTIPTDEDGKYLVSATVAFAGDATGQRAVVFYVDGAPTSSTLVNSGDVSSDAEYVTATDVLDLAAGQYVEVYVYQQSGGALNIGSATREFTSQMAIVKLNSSITGSSALPTDSASKTDSNVAVGASVDAIDTSIDITVSAEAGDVLLVSASGKWDTDGSQIPCLDAATIVSAAAVNWLSGVGSPSISNRGVQAWIGENFTSGRVGFGGTVSYVVQAGDIENGTVTLRLYGWEGASGSNQLLCNAGGPFQWSVVNLRAVGAPRAAVGDGAPSNPAVGQLWYDSDASPSGAGGTGAAFPTSPTTGDTYRRSDLDYITFFWDGTRWLSENKYAVPYSVKESLGFDGLAADESTAGRVALPKGPGSNLGLYIDEIALTTYVLTTNNGSNYWTLTFTTHLSGSTILTVDTSADTASTHTGHAADGLGIVIPTTDIFVLLAAAKTGSPGNLYTPGHPVFYGRLIAT